MRGFKINRALLLVLTVIATAIYSPGCMTVSRPHPPLFTPTSPLATSTAEDLAQTGPGHITITFWHASTGEEGEALQTLIAEFNAQNENGIIVKAEGYGDYDYVMKRIVAAIALGSPPDLAIAYGSQIATYAAADALVPLDGYIANEEWGLLLPTDIFPVALEADRFSTFNHEILGFLLDCSLEVMFYNIDLLQAAGFEGNPPQTWEEFAEMCRAVSKGTTSGYTFIPDASTLISWILSHGGELIDQDGERPRFNEDPGVEALTLLADLMDGGQAYQAADFDSMLMSFANGWAAFVTGSTDNLPAYIEATTDDETGKPRFKWSIAPLPHSTAEPVILARGPSLVLFVTTPERQLAAWRFVRWLTQKEQATRWALATQRFPIRRSVAEMEEMAAYFEMNPLYAKAFGFLPYSRAEPAIASWETVRGILYNAMAEVVSLGKSPRTALNDAAIKAHAALSEQR